MGTHARDPQSRHGRQKVHVDIAGLKEFAPIGEAIGALKKAFDEDAGDQKDLFPGTITETLKGIIQMTTLPTPKQTPQKQRLLQGEFLKCVDGLWACKSGSPAPEGEIVVVAQEIIDTLWEDDRPVEHRRESAGELLASVKEANERIPKSEWRDGPNGLQGPWNRQFYVWLFDPATGSMFTYANDTVGAEYAFTHLRQAIEWTTRYRKQELAAVVRLSDAPMPTQYGVKRRPRFEVVELIPKWSGDDPAQMAIPPNGSPRLTPPAAASPEYDEDDEVVEAPARRVRRK